MEDATLVVFEASVFVCLMIVLGILIRGAVAVKDRIFNRED